MTVDAGPGFALDTRIGEVVFGWTRVEDDGPEKSETRDQGDMHSLDQMESAIDSLDAVLDAALPPEGQQQ